MQYFPIALLPIMLKGLSQQNPIILILTTLITGRNDANPATHCFVTSPEMTVALTLAGSLEFNPTKDSIKCPDGSELKLAEPFGDGLPVRGFDPGEDTYQVETSQILQGVP